MVDSKFIKICSAFNTEEWKYLRWFVQSNFFNTDPNLLRLYEALAKHHPGFSSKAMAKETLYHKVFTGQAYHDGKWRNLATKMTKLLEEYLVCLEWQQDKYLKEKLLISAFERRNIDFEEFKKKTVGLIKELDNLPFRDEDYYFSKMELQRKLYYQSTTVGEVESESLVDEAIESLDFFYSFAKLKLVNEIQNRKVAMSKSASELTTQRIPSDYELYKIHSWINGMDKEADESLYSVAKTAFVSNLENIRNSEQKVIIKFFLNFTAKMIRVNASKYLVESFELYKIANSRNLLITNGLISNTSFVNIVNVAARVKEFDWADSFIQQNFLSVEEKARKEIVSLARGFLAFSKKDYSLTIDYLTKLDFDDVLYQLLAKSLELKAFYEMSIKDASFQSFLKSYSQSFEKFVIRNSEIGKKKSGSYLLFIRFVRRLAAYRQYNELDKAMQATLAKEVENAKELVERDWLKSKIFE